MQIILQEDVEKLGHRGDVVTVKPGYARNFLLPRKLGIEATLGNMKALERIRTSLAKKTATELDAAQSRRNSSMVLPSGSRARPVRTTRCSARSPPPIFLTPSQRRA